MSPTWPPELRKELETLKVELTDRITRIKADASKPLEADFAEQATQRENQEVLHALGSEGEEQLAKVNAALRRMDAGNYGVCVECGVTIQPGRLAARPYASRCINCASKA